MVVGTVQTKTFQIGLCWFITSSSRHPHQALYQLREVGISFAIDGYFITACSAEGDTKDESLRRGTCTLWCVWIPATRRGTCLQWHLIAGCSLNFVADLIQSLVIGRGNIQKIVMSSDVLKREMLRLDQIEWTLGMRLFKQLRVQLFSLVLSWFGLASHALVAQHGHMWTCNMNQPNSKLNIIDMYVKRFGHQWLISSILFVFWIRRLLFSGLPIASTGRLTELRNFVENITTH